MPKIVAALALSLLVAVPGALDSGASTAAGADDRAAVERAVKDYVEAIYEVKPELIERSVSPELVKFGLWRGADADAYRGMPMRYDQLVEIARTWNAGGKQGEGLAYEVEVLDLLDVTASAKLTARWGVDYMHLVRGDDGRWRILQILWQSHPREAAAERVTGKR